MSDDTQREPNVPADQGLSTLGVIMQLFGTLSGVLAVGFLIVLLVLGEYWDWLTIVLVAMSGVRSYFHARAGATLPSGFAGIRRYITFSLVQAGVMLALEVTQGAPLRIALASTVGLLVWPAALGVMIGMPRFSRFATALPLAEDKGFEGLAVVMSIMGATGVIQWGAMLVVLLLSLPDIIELGDIYVYLFLAGIAALFVRSFIHVRAGLAGVRETDFARSVRLGNRYAIVGFAVSVIVTGILAFTAVFQRLDFVFLPIIACIGWALLAWPLIVRRFVGERQLAALSDDDVHHRAPDAGLTGLGWLLIANAMMTLSFLLPEIVAGPGAVGSYAVFTHFLAKLTLVDPTSIAWNLSIVAVELWAGIELVRMSSRFRFAATLFAVVAGGSSLLHSSPQMFSFEAMRHLAPEEILAYVPLATNLVLPIATWLLVRRRTVAAAHASYRPDPS